MRIERFLPFVILGAALLISVALVGNVSAQPAPEKLAELTYPIKELGGCTGLENCAKYCDSPKNLEACVAYARKNNLMEGEQLERAEKFVAADGKGPGGCASEASCERYCDDIGKIDECLDWADKNGMPVPEEARKIQAALKRGVTLPPGCTSKDQCEQRCKGGTPGLSAAERIAQMKTCITFAKEADIIPPEERAEVDKVLAAVERGIVPPSCGGKEACGEYCSEDEHIEECIGFAEAAGFMDPKQAKMARLTGGKGPGGCKGEACEGICEDPKNQEMCAKFMTELLDKHPDLDINDFIPEEDRERMQEGMEQMRESLEDAPDEVKACINEAIPGLTEKIESGNFGPRDMMKIGPKMRNIMEPCFNAMRPDFPPEVRDCIVAAGVDPEFKEGPPSPEQEDAMKECFMQFGGGEGFGLPGEGEFEDSEFGHPGEDFGSPGGMRGGMPGGGMPPGAKECMERLGIGTNRPPTAAQMGEIQKCVGEQMRQRGGFPGEGAPGMMGPGREEDHDEFMPGEDGEDFGPPEGFEPSAGMMEQFRDRPPTTEEMQRMQSGFTPPAGATPGTAPTPGQIQEQYQQQYQEEYQRQYDGQRQQIEQQYQQQFNPPSGGEPMPLPGGGSGYAPSYQEFAFEEDPAIGRDAPTLLGFVLQSLIGILGGGLGGE